MLWTLQPGLAVFNQISDFVSGEGWIEQHLCPTDVIFTGWLAAFHNMFFIVTLYFLRLFKQIHACKPPLPQTSVCPTEEGRVHGQAEQEADS